MTRELFTREAAIFVLYTIALGYGGATIAIQHVGDSSLAYIAGFAVGAMALHPVAKRLISRSRNRRLTSDGGEHA